MRVGKHDAVRPSSFSHPRILLYNQVALLFIPVLSHESKVSQPIPLPIYLFPLGFISFSAFAFITIFGHLQTLFYFGKL